MLKQNKAYCQLDKSHLNSLVCVSLITNGIKCFFFFFSCKTDRAGTVFWEHPDFLCVCVTVPLHVLISICVSLSSVCICLGTCLYVSVLFSVLLSAFHIGMYGSFDLCSISWLIWMQFLGRVSHHDPLTPYNFFSDQFCRVQAFRRGERCECIQRELSGYII